MYVLFRQPIMGSGVVVNLGGTKPPNRQTSAVEMKHDKQDAA
jgi:hypothetical protein